MLKLKKFYVRYLVAILLCLGMLVVQAKGQLDLPDMMSQIVTTGIQAGGNEDQVPELVDSTTYSHLQSVMLEPELLENDYEYVTKADLGASLQSKYPDFAECYRLKDITVGDKDTLKNNMAVALILVNMVDNNPDQASSLLEMTQGMDFYVFMSVITSDQKAQIINSFSNQLTQMGESNLVLAVSGAVLDFYENMGASGAKIQSDYVLNKGIEMLGVTLLVTVATILGGLFSARVGAGVAKDIRKAVFEKVAQFSQNEFNHFSTASLITRTTNDITQVQNVVIMLLRIAMFAPIMGVMAIYKAVNFAPTMTWIVWLVLAVLLVIIMGTFTIVLPKFKIVQKLVDKINLVMRENLSGLLVIRAFSNEDVAKRRFEDANKDLLDVNLFVNRVMGALMPIMMFIFNATTLLVIFYGAKEADTGSIAIGQIMAFMQYAMQILMSFLMLAMIFFMVPRASVASKRIFEVLDLPVEINDPKVPKKFKEDKKGSLEFENVTYCYPHANEAVLSDISFKVAPQQVTAIIGSTGSGKSTLINLIPRLIDATVGVVKVNGVDVAKVKQHDLREVIGLVPQNAKLFSGTIRENIKYGNDSLSDKQIQEILETAQAWDFVSAMPEGIDTPVAQGGSNFSGGQKQRLAIARALAKEADIYIFDDSFSALDFKTDATLRAKLAKMLEKKKAAVLIVGQRIASIMHANQIVVLDKGKVVGVGTHKELLESCQVYQEIAASQLSKEELERG